MISIEKLDLPDITADNVREEYVHYESSGSTHRFQMAEDNDFYLGNQLTKRQQEYLVSVGQPPEPNNKIRPAVEQVLANIASSSPVWDAIPIGKTDNDFAFVSGMLMENIWYNSNGDVQYRSCCKDYIVKGLTYMFVYPDWNGEGGLGSIKVKRLPAEAVFVDPNSALPDYEDAVSLIYSDLHTKEALKTMLPQFADEIEEAEEDYYKNELSTGQYSRDNVQTAADVDDNRLPKVRKFIRFSKVNIPNVLITDLATGTTKKLDKGRYAELLNDERYEELVDTGLIEERIIYETKVRETFVVGDILIYDEVLPITIYPIKPACNEYTGTPYSSGDVRHAKSPQRMLNRTEALIIAHTSAQSGNKVWYESGAIEPDQMSKINIPNAAVEVNTGALSNGKIHFHGNVQMSSELYHEKSRYEIDIETVFGAYKFLQGNPAGSPGTVGEAQIIDEAVARKQNWKVIPLYDMLTAVAKVAMEWVPYVYDQQRVLRLVNPYQDRKEIILNQMVTDDHSESVMKLYDMVSNKVDIKVVVGSARAKSPMAELNMNIGLMNAGIYDKHEVIMNLPGKVDKNALMARMDEMGQLKQMVQQQADQIKQLSGDIQTRERELFHANMRAEISEATKPIAQAQANLKAQSKLEEARQRDETRSLKAVNSQPEAPYLG